LFIATLIADGLSTGDTAEAADRLRDAGLTLGEGRWIDEAAAFDLPFHGDAAAARRALEGAIGKVDIVVQEEPAAKRLCSFPIWIRR
jgi:phosphoserine phosphatase